MDNHSENVLHVFLCIPQNGLVESETKRTTTASVLHVFVHASWVGLKGDQKESHILLFGILRQTQVNPLDAYRVFFSIAVPRYGVRSGWILPHSEQPRNRG